MFLYKQLCKPKLLHFKSKLSIIIASLIGCSFAASPLRVNATESNYPELIYHVHTGDEQTGGGCYTNAILHEHTDSCYNTYDCKWRFDNHYNKWDFINDYTLVFISDCGERHEQQGDLGDACSVSDHGTHHDLICTHSGEIDRYDLGCGYDTTTPVGLLNVIKSTDDWSRELLLYIGHNGSVTDSATPYYVNGEACNGIYTASSNGTYIIHMDTNSNCRVADISVPVSNIDNTPPSLSCLADTTEWTLNDINVIATASDLQPDQTNGCGNITYSFDNGVTWHDYNSYSFDENGQYTIYARDLLGNTNQYTFNISNIDRESPNITVEYDKTPNLPSLEVNVTANDTMSSGQEGCGLAKEAYSFDGGKTWSENSSVTINDNGLVEIVVRDNLGNTENKSISITNIDKYAPKFTVTSSTDEWTNQDVEITIEATDFNPDGSEGCGIHETGYSFDGGQTWSDKATRVINENSEIEIAVRDCNQNVSSEAYEILNIDKDAPLISLSYNLSEDKHEAYLTVTAKDTASGLTDSPYKWNSGDYSGSNSYTVNKNSHYTVSVRDNAGNISVAGIDVEDIELPKPTPEPTPVIEPEPEPAIEPEPEPVIEPEPAPLTEPEPKIETDPVIEEVPENIPDPVVNPDPGNDPKPADNPVPKITPVSKPVNPDSPVSRNPKPVVEEPTPDPVITPVVIEKVIEEPPVSTPKIVDISDLPPLEDDSTSTLLSIILAILLGLLLGGLIFALLFALSRMIIIYCDLGHNKSKLVGITFAHKRRDAFEANISQNVIDACDSGHLNLRFTMAFIYLHSEEDVTIYLPDKKSFIVVPDTKVPISINNY